MTARPPSAASCEARLLDVMHGGEWHDARALEEIGGRRFPARLHDAQAAGRITYECRRKPGTQRYEYRLQPLQAPASGAPAVPRESSPRSPGDSVSQPLGMSPWGPIVVCSDCGTSRYEDALPHSPRLKKVLGQWRKVDCAGRAI